MAKRMTARYGSRCTACPVYIEPGDQILFDGTARHAECPEKAPEPEYVPTAQPVDSRPDTIDLGDLTPVLALFASAAAEIKFPKVRLTTETGRKILVSVAGEKARAPGTVNVSDDLRWDDPNRRWYGRVNLDGTWTPRDAPADVVEIIRAFAADPAAVAAAYGHATGNCCFCARDLSDERSTSVGYGPICAGRYGLPWGDRPAPKQVVDTEAEEDTAYHEQLADWDRRHDHQRGV